MKQYKNIRNKRITYLVLSFVFLLFCTITFVLTLGRLNDPTLIYNNDKLSGIVDNVAHINELDQDYYHYKGLNVTENDTGTLPTGTIQNRYPDNRLVEMEITYFSKNYNSDDYAYVSLSEMQDTYIYYKVSPVKDNGTPSNLSDDYVLLDLIENPFTNRPDDFGFNNWVTDYQNVTISHDADYYERSAKIPVTYTNSMPDKIEIQFNASWVEASVAYLNGSTNWSNAFDYLDNSGMKELGAYGLVAEPYDMSGYFTLTNLSWNQSCTGMYDQYGNYQSGNCRCRSWWGGCDYYEIISNEDFVEGNTYYYLDSYMRVLDNSTLPIVYHQQFASGFDANSNMTGFYRQIDIPRYSSIDGYYDNNGYIQSGTCSTYGGCTYYELIQFYDSLGAPEIIDLDETYYYLVTRDTNIVVMTSTQYSAWGSGQNKPFTLTSIHNGNDYRSTVTWDTNRTVTAYNDTNIENIRIASGEGYTTTVPTGNTYTSRIFYGYFNNIRFGRGIVRSGTNSSFRSIIGGNNNSTGSSSNVTKYKVIIESGFYSSLALSNGASSAYTNYIENKSIYGNDYDKITTNNNSLEVYFVASGSWGGNVYSSSSIRPIYDLTVKSGSFGTSMSDHTTGIYVGGRQGGTHNAPRMAKIEGGWIYNLIGGPLTASNRGSLNDSYIYMTGGEVDVIVGGAGTSATYGNRIVQVTGGKVNYNIFGGSNGYNGSGSDGTVIGSSYIYLGGDSVIGDQTLVTNNSSIWGAEAGSVFGIGNGRSGYSTIGSSSNSNIFITDDSIINKNVYGGGNYGATGISSGTSSTYSNITLYGGTVNGNIFGGGNNNGAGNSSVTATINIDTFEGDVNGAIYGGSNVLGTIYGDVSINAESGNIASIYGGGLGGYDNSTNPGTFVRDSIDITLGNGSSFPTISGNVYGGSAYGSVNTTTNSSTPTNEALNITVNNALISGDIFGGGKGNATYYPYVAGYINLTVNNGEINRLFGGNDASGEINRNPVVNLNGGIINDAFGGGNQVEANITQVNLDGATVGRLFGGSNLSGEVTESNITVTSGTVGSVYGGNNQGGTTLTTNVLITGGNSTNVYGGGRLADTTTSNIDLNNGLIQNVYGGGDEANLSTTNITIDGSNITTVYGGSNLSGNVNNSNIIVNSGTPTNIYGGNNLGGSTTNTQVTYNNGTSTNVYGGGKFADTTESILNLTGGTVENVYGGGDEANLSTTNITIDGSNITTVYGGSNNSGNVNNSNIIVNSGTPTNIYGGNNLGGSTTNTLVTYNNGTSTNLYGGGKFADTTESVLNLNGGTIENVYGGGDEANLNIVGININDGNITNVYGGSNSSGTVPNSNITVNNGEIDTIYGGNNLGGTTTNTFITINDGLIANIYGGGYSASTTSSTIDIINNSGKIENIFGGGYSADIDNTNIDIVGGVIGSIYGGSNHSGTVNETNIITSETSGLSEVEVMVDFTASDSEEWQSTTYPTVVTLDVTLKNNTSNEIVEYDGNLYIEDSTMFTNFSSTQLLESNSNYSFDENNIHYATNPIPANSEYTFTVTFLTMQDKDNVIIKRDLIGYDSSSNEYEYDSHTYPIIDNVYGGNNQGGTVNISNLDINSGLIDNIYGGGNEADILTNTFLDITNTKVINNIYGGGNEAVVFDSTDVKVNNTEVIGSIYAGGNGVSATVYGDTTLYLDGESHIHNHVFGGGNAAATGSEVTNDSSGIVYISGGIIDGNVYGGANTSVLYGTTVVNIGHNISGVTLSEEDIHIGGTVFGGGEANASGSEEYDYSFISVTNGIEMNILGSDTLDLTIDGSIFGSGNASSTTGFSSIYLDNYGDSATAKRNISIQRADLLTLDNSYIELFGATDRTNEYSSTLFTLSRIEELKMINNSTLYLETGANLLEEVNSYAVIDNVEVKAEVTIDGTNVTKNVDNRIYMREGKNLNISTNESVTAYGTVNGMTFFGMFNRDRDGFVDTAFYSSDYNYGDTVKVGEFYHFADGSYVLGRHKTNHDIEVDGFYTHIENEEQLDTIEVTYITPTPESSSYYMWVVGEAVAAYDIDLTASKYSTLGTYELPLLNFTEPNTEFNIVGVNFNEANQDLELVRQSEIPRISQDGTADTKMSLVMKTSNTGWITVGETNFLTDEVNPIYGTTNYLSENSHTVPSLLFYIYHSKNLETSGDLGTVTVSVLAVTPIDDLTNEVERININISLSRVLYATNEYEAAMTPGEEHDMFVTTSTDITSESKLSAYYSLFVETDEPFYESGDYRAIASSFVLPENTTFTMIDLTESTPVYYHYVVSAADVISATDEYNIHGEASYKLSKFIRMGSTTGSNNYDDSAKNNDYYDSSSGLVLEEFVFIVDFSQTDITTDKLNNSMLLELRNYEDQTTTSVLGILHSNMIYNLHHDKKSVIELDVTSNKSNIYIGESVNLDVNTNFVQQTVDSRVIHDTSFYYQKLGLKITLLDSSGDVVNGASLMGVSLKYNDVNYYPQMDGIFRINISPRVANVSSRIEVVTKNSNLPSGNYQIKIESFGSPDGIYFGLESSDTKLINLSILNNIFGLVTTLNESSVIIDKTTGLNQNGNNGLIFNLKYSSGLSNPRIRISLKRRLYDEVYSNNYEIVDIGDYITNGFTLVGDPEKFEYQLINNPLPEQDVFIYMDELLVSGTYKVIFSLYDGNNYIGEVYNYVIIK